MNLSEKKLKELKENKISIEDLYDKYFYTKKDRVNVENIRTLLNENSCSFQEIVDKIKSIKDGYSNSCLYVLLWNTEFFEELIENNKLNKEDLEYLLNRIDNDDELHALVDDVRLLKYIVENELFKELVDRFKSRGGLYKLLKNKELFEGLIENKKLNTDDLKYLLNRIDENYELDYLCENTSLIKHILNEFVLDKELVDKLNTVVEESYLCRDRNIHTIFERIEYENNYNEEVLKLTELNKKVYLLTNFDLIDEQKLEIYEILRNNEQARNRLIQIVDNHLEDQYDFESLKSLLTKDSKKMKIKMNI